MTEILSHLSVISLRTSQLLLPRCREGAGYKNQWETLKPWTDRPDSPTDRQPTSVMQGTGGKADRKKGKKAEPQGPVRYCREILRAFLLRTYMLSHHQYYAQYSKKSIAAKPGREKKVSNSPKDPGSPAVVDPSTLQPTLPPGPPRPAPASTRPSRARPAEPAPEASQISQSQTPKSPIDAQITQWSGPRTHTASLQPSLSKVLPALPSASLSVPLQGYLLFTEARHPIGSLAP
ncbi:hypothetical protein F4819DRAFT_274530 [Hypoxylon fuscum]|nr:hypothetical protein F4819DRAFT_274530 [Hypoxylon fuscum]